MTIGLKFEMPPIYGGKDTFETERLIKEDLGQEDLQIAAIGPAGENLVRIAAIIINLDHASARTGIRAFMDRRI